MPEWMKVVVGLTILVIMVSLSMSLFVTIIALAKAIWRKITKKRFREFTTEELTIIVMGLDSLLEEGPNEEGKEKILQIIDRVDEEKWEKLKEEEHERLLDS